MTKRGGGFAAHSWLVLVSCNKVFSCELQLFIGVSGRDPLLQYYKYIFDFFSLIGNARGVRPMLYNLLCNKKVVYSHQIRGWGWDTEMYTHYTIHIP